MRIARRFPEKGTEASDFVLLHGRLSFRKTDGSDAGMPLWMQRVDAPNSGQDLRIHIGDRSDAAARLTIGPLDASTERVVMAVKAEDAVDIPTGTLNFGEKHRQMVNLWKKAFAVGTQTETLYFRSDNDFCWFRAGVHADGRSDPGAGGTLQLRLDQDARLHFGARTRQMLNLYLENYGIGVQLSTLYARSDADFCWFRGGAHNDTRGSAGGGTLQMKLDDGGNLTLYPGDLSLESGDVIVNGGSIDLRETGGGSNTDPFMITRRRVAYNQSDLRIVLGDDQDGTDRLVIGPNIYPSGNFLEKFVLKNNGDLVIAGSLYLGNSQKLPIDVVSGEVFINKQGNDSGTHYLLVTSRLSHVSTAVLIVALSDIQNVNTAVDARWRVSAGTGTAITSNIYEFPVYWRVDDIDGYLRSFSWVAIFGP
jgi:hypothetical protein